MLVMGEMGEAFIIFVPSDPGNPLSGGSSAGLNFFTGGFAAGLYAAAYLYLGIQVKALIQGMLKSRKKESQVPLAEADESVVAATKTVDMAIIVGAVSNEPIADAAPPSLRSTLIKNNIIALLGHFVLIALVTAVMYLINSATFGQEGGFELTAILWVPSLSFFILGWPVAVVHFIFGALALKPLPKLNFLSVISIILYSTIILFVLPLFTGSSLVELFVGGGIWWSLSYLVPVVILAFVMYLGIFARALFAGKFMKQSSDD
jgi:hypothetical protein